ncbi:hypothetical protein FH972_024148 [Carpinus fangiana]|uniref:DUF7924 domain-containing protein n=1 Tax=Carpinus fangiana TaxID=176857 RepID=A0A5N6KXH6_9ROSI|nr:hypothetical protein FH972_024148 [Carpinus fangiana]
MSSDQSLKTKGSDEGVSSKSSSSSKIAKIKKTASYDPAFAQHILDHGIYLNGYGPGEESEEDDMRPSNFDDIDAKLRKPRPSLSPSRFQRKDFRNFTRENIAALSESDVARTVFPAIIGRKKIPCSSNIEFNNLAPLTDGGLSSCRPDYYEGSRPADLNKLVRNEIEKHIVPSSDTSRPCLPNFFAELKGPDGNTAVAQRQACYDGALGARGIHKLRAYVNEKTALDGNAYSVTTTYSGGSGSGHLTIYTMHPTASKEPDRELDYRMTRVRSFALMDSIDTFRAGATAIRNAHEWAQEQRADLIQAANDLASSAVPQTESQPLPILVDSDSLPTSDSVDETHR